ncbi:unnamed protein product [Colias eurytheme]|nr:unnamed protein product [Colias eurytheme]
MPKRCILGCPYYDFAMHRFPDAKKFPERLKTWVNLVGGRLETLSDIEYYKKQVICDIHFCEAYRNRNNRLNALAVPTLHLPGLNLSQITSGQASTSTQHNLEPTLIQQVNSEPSVSHATSEQPSPSLHNLLPSTSQPIAADPSQTFSLVNNMMMEHNYSAISRPRRKTVKDPAAPLRTKIKQLQTDIMRLRKKGESFKARLKSAEDYSNNTLFKHFANNFKKPARLFLSMQLQAAKNPKGRRFTTEEKILALSLYKKSPKSYSLLNKYFTLPSAKSMKRLLGSIKINAGINPIVFEKIKKTLSEKNENDRLCSLMFDEMSLTPQVNYNCQKDSFEGFAFNKLGHFADHALVFMIKGVKQNFKQPIAYYFTSRLNKTELKNIITTVIQYAQDSGLIIVNTVCDQSTVNVGAITELVTETKAKYLRRGKEWRYDHMSIDRKKIVPLFDVPHLIKGIRNNLLNKDLVYTSNNVQKTVKWEYFQKLYAADKSYGELRLLDKLTEEHINPEKINKMRVKTATQLFSHSVAVATEHLSARGDLPESCKQLIDITLLFDNLFDSLNVSTLHVPNGKKYKGPIKRHSPHHELWIKAKIILKTIKFTYIKSTGNKSRLIETNIPSITNLIKTIEGMEAIWNIVSQRYGFDALLTRNFNQDPVENFFGNIRSYGARNNAPNSVAFEGAFKALLLNNYSSPHSGRANCEEDSNKCLQTLEFFLTEKSTPHAFDAPKENEAIEYNENVLNVSRESDAGQRNYVCGWVLSKCLKNIVKNCKNCRQNLIDHGDNHGRNKFIRAKEYANKKWLCYPSEELENSFHDLQNIATGYLKNNVPKQNIKRNIKLLADVMVEYPFNCTTHIEKLKEYFINVTLNVLLYSWCRSINRILSGKLNYVGDDETKIAAQKYYEKHKHYKNKK